MSEPESRLPASSCPACNVVRGARFPPGGLLYRGEGFVLHALMDPSPVAGWVVLTSERHVRGLSDLSAEELSALGPLSARVMRAQLRGLGADHVYAFAIGEVLEHFHLHLVPRYPTTPSRLRGRHCFDAGADDLLPEPRLLEAAAVVQRELARSPLLHPGD